MTKKIWIIVGLALGWAANASATEGLSLKQAEHEALKSSPYYQRAEAVESETSWGSYQSLAEGFLPQVSITGNYFFEQQYSYLNVQFGPSAPISFPGIYPQSTINLDARMDIFDGFKNVHQMDSADRTHEGAE